MESAKAALRDVRFEPFGTARELYVGTLLALADHMDGSVMRAVPRYVTSDEEIGFKGAFRRLVSGTGYDPATYAIKTTLSGFDGVTEPMEKYFNFKECYTHFERGYRDDKPSWKEIEATDSEPDTRRCDLYAHLVHTCCGIGDAKPPRMFFQCVTKHCGKNEKSSIIRRKKKATAKDENGDDKTVDHKSVWPADNTLAMVLNDLGENRRFLGQVQDELYEMGLPVDGWFDEFGSEVYDDRGDRVNEPALNEGLLERVAREMWELRCRVLGGSLMTYGTLADSLRMEEVALVATAVRRIARRVNSANDPPRIVAGASGWAFSGHPFELRKLVSEVKTTRGDPGASGESNQTAPPASLASGVGGPGSPSQLPVGRDDQTEERWRSHPEPARPDPSGARATDHGR
jgi:hypothetical protein